MFRSLVIGAASAAVLCLSSCNCGPNNVNAPCTTNADCSGGLICVGGKCVGGNNGGGAGGSGGSGGAGGGSTVVSRCSPTNTDNATRDTDCDGLTDSEEYSLSYANGAPTDPCNSDTDGDGVSDG